MLKSLWEDIRRDPENYRNQNVSLLMENLKHQKEREKIVGFSQKWQVKEEELAYLVSNYNPNKTKQSGESELKNTSDYTAYRNKSEEPVSKLRYWKEVRTELTEMIGTEILPLRES